MNCGNVEDGNEAVSFPTPSHPLTLKKEWSFLHAFEVDLMTMIVLNVTVILPSESNPLHSLSSTHWRLGRVLKCQSLPHCKSVNNGLKWDLHAHRFPPDLATRCRCELVPHHRLTMSSNTEESLHANLRIILHSD